MNNTNYLYFIFPITVLFNLSSTTYSKSVIEPCSSSDSCPSLLSYNLPFDSKLSQIAYRFNINVSDILSSNYISPSLSPSAVIPSNSLIRIPISCPCIDGIRRSLSTLYTVGAADTADSISEGYGGLVSGEQIESVNGVTNDKPLMSGEQILIELPCTCFRNIGFDGSTAVYLSYVVQGGDSLSGIGKDYGTTVGELQQINGLEQAQVNAGDILAVPIPACSSSNLNWYNESLLVPNGSYALTANDCIKCSCDPFNLNLQCSPSGIAVSCSHLRCKGSNLFIGDSTVIQTPSGCKVTECLYRGHHRHKIFRSLESSSDRLKCTGDHNGAVGSPFSSPIPIGHDVPFTVLSPSTSPLAAYGPSSLDAPNSIQKQSGNSHTIGGRRRIQTLFLVLLLLFSLNEILIGS